jgi:hypothetical protein
MAYFIFKKDDDGPTPWYAEKGIWTALREVGMGRDT